MNKKLLWMSVSLFILGFILMWFNFQIIFFLGLVAFFLFILWTGPKADGHYTDERYAYEKQQSIKTMILAAAFIGSGFLALIIQTFIL